MENVPSSVLHKFNELPVRKLNEVNEACQHKSISASVQMKLSQHIREASVYYNLVFFSFFVIVSLTFVFLDVNLLLQYKLAVIAALVASASAFAPAIQITRSTAIGQHIGSGGMADTRNPDAKDDEDPRKSISAAPSFEEYLKQREAEGK